MKCHWCKNELITALDGRYQLWSLQCPIWHCFLDNIGDGDKITAYHFYLESERGRFKVGGSKWLNSVIIKKLSDNLNFEQVVFGWSDYKGWNQYVKLNCFLVPIIQNDIVKFNKIFKSIINNMAFS